MRTIRACGNSRWINGSCFSGGSRWVRNIIGAATACLLVESAHAETDEIQVYDANINSPGQFSLQLHNNYTPTGRKRPDFEGGIIPNRTLNGVPNGPGRG